MISKTIFFIVSANINPDTGCPLNVETKCENCAEDQNRLGCACVLDSGDFIITANIFTPCRPGKKKNRNFLN